MHLITDISFEHTSFLLFTILYSLPCDLLSVPGIFVKCADVTIQQQSNGAAKYIYYVSAPRRIFHNKYINMLGAVLQCQHDYYSFDDNLPVNHTQESMHNRP